MGFDMIKAGEGDYLSAKTYEEGEKITLTIKDVKQETFKDKDTQEDVTKYVLYFREEDKGLVLNKTNIGTLGGLLGRDSDSWKGKGVTFLVTSSPVGAYFKAVVPKSTTVRAAKGAEDTPF